MESEFVSGKHRFIVLYDEIDAELVAAHHWCLKTAANTSLQYAMAQIHGHMHRMHRMILQAKPGQLVDHINRNGLDNRRSNLRLCSHSDNMHNSKIRKQNTTGFKGVTWYGHKYPSKPFVAQIMANRQPRFLGCFATAEEASAAYEKAAKELHGNFARF